MKTEVKEEAVKGQGKGVNLLASKIIILFFIICTFTSKAQDKVPEIGITLGTTQYMGDLNPGNPYYKPSLAASALFNYNLNQRTGVRIRVSYISIKGEGILNINGNQKFHAFNNNFINYNAAYYINFTDYDFELNKHNFTPYFLFGLGYSKVIKSNNGAQDQLYLPFGPGCKFLIKNKISIGLEYTFNRWLGDRAEGVEVVNKGDFVDGTSFLQNKDQKGNYPSKILNTDWYSHLSLVITFKFINFADDCPAYH